MDTITLTTKCVHCNKEKGYHNAVTAQCPAGKKDRTFGYTRYGETAFEPKPDKKEKEQKPKLSRKAKALIESFTSACAYWGVQQEYGSGKEVGRAEKAFKEEYAELTAFVLALEQKLKASTIAGANKSRPKQWIGNPDA